MGTLYVIGTPIGNLEDLTRRSVRVLGQVSLIAAEDTRVTLKLLNHLNLHVPLTSCHQHNWQAKLPTILKTLESGDVALVTDAGMPAISDPGSELVAAVAAEGFVVEVVPGVSAVTTALAASGLSGDRFLFLGFLPRRNKERRALLASTIRLTHNLVIFESPHRVGATLQNLLVALGDRDLAVCRELTKLHEETWRGTLAGAVDHYVEAPKGEVVIVVAGAPPADEPNDQRVLAVVTEARSGGASTRDAADEAAKKKAEDANKKEEDVKHKINVNDVYEYYYMKHLHYNKNWLFKNFEKFTSVFSSNMARTSSDIYLYWLDNWTEKRHEEILDSVNEFIISGNYRIISD